MLGLQFHKFTKHFIKSTNVRYSGKSNWKQQQKQLIRHALIEHPLIGQTLDQNRKPTTTEWHELRQKLLLSVANKSTINVDGVILALIKKKQKQSVLILEKCLPDQLDTGKSYIEYLKESGRELSTGTLAKLLSLYYSASKRGVEITAKDQQDIIDMYDHFLEKISVFDSTLGSAVIHGLVLTADWRKSLEVLDSMKMFSKPPSLAYSCVVQRALQEGDVHLVWNLLDTMATECKVLHNEVFTSYIGHCEHNVSSFTENIDKMLTFIKDNRILVTREVVNEFSRVFSRFNYSCSVTTVSKQGKCHSCRKRLLRADLTEDEFNSLSSHFLDKVLIGNNIFAKSTPQELDFFKAFIDKTRPYDCVIDGLNTSHLKHASSPSVQATLLASVVKHFVDRNKTVLVIGRKHMLGWPNAQMTYVRNNSKLFLTENLSQDDPFFLYSTLKSGPNTDFVTRDLIRDHAFKLDKELKAVFRRWQQQHQYMVKFVADNGRVTFDDRIEFDMNVQQVDEGCWHIPFEDSSHCTFQENYFELCKNWLCVSKKH